MVIWVGIDEAGYGPLLGPLVVSAAALALPAELLRGDLWKTLGKAVAKEKRHLKGRLLITDSKKAYTPASGTAHLRRTVLSCLSAADRTVPHPQTIAELIGRLAPATLPRLENYPWHRNLHDIALDENTQALDVAASVLASAMSANGIRLVGLSSRCLDVGYYNTRVEAARNKSRVLFAELCGLISELIGRDEDGAFQFVVDRQGGRVQYHHELMRMFPDAELTVIRQDPAMSSYALTTENKTFRIHFTAGADDRFLPVALASMTSKYLREVLMHSQNAFFSTLCPTLKPTAGYWQDGQRFVKELTEKCPDFVYDRKNFIRSL